MISLKPAAASLALLFPAVLCAQTPTATPEDPRVVFQVGRAIRSTPVANLTAEGTEFTVKTTADGFTAGQKFDKALASYVQGDRPAFLDRATALILMDKPKDGLKLLEPFLEQQKASAGLPGNQWDDVAIVAIIGYGLAGDAARCNQVTSQLADTLPSATARLYTALAKALLMPNSAPLDERVTSLSNLISDSSPPEVSAYASFVRGQRLQRAGKKKEALEAYLIIPCAYPTGGSVLNGIAEMSAAEILVADGRREEAVLLFTSASAYVKSTPAAEQAAKRLKTIK